MGLTVVVVVVVVVVESSPSSFAINGGHGRLSLFMDMGLEQSPLAKD